MSVANGSTLRVSTRFHGTEGQDIVNVYHLEASFTASQSEEDVTDAIAAHLADALWPITQLMPITATKGDIKIDRVVLVPWPDAPEGQPPWKEDIVANVGWVDMDAALEPPYVGEFLPAGVAALVYWKTIRGRSPGKTFLGQIVEAMQLGNDWHATFKAGAATYIGAILDGVTISAGNTLAFGVLSRATQTFLEFLSGELKQYAAYQRRRRVGSGA